MLEIHGAIRDQLAVLGHAEVVATLRRPVGATLAPPPDLLPCFLVALPPGQGRGPCLRYFPRLGVMIGLASAAGIAGLAADPRVQALAPALVPSLIRPVRRTAAKATRAAIAWGIEAVGAPALWDSGARGQGVRIGQLDTGVDAGHPALRRRIAAWAEFDWNGELVPGSRPHDPDGHGTHTAGTLVGLSSGGTRIGVAPEAELCAALVIEGGRALLRIVAGLEWAIEQGVRVLSLSLGIRGYSPFAIEIVQRLREAGVLPVAAIGNEGAGTSRSPGNYPEALSVGALDRKGTVASFSSSMRFERETEPTAPDVVAPGVEILSLRPGGGRVVMDGTSMATPHVAGLAALLFSAKPEATVAEVEAAIVEATRPLPEGADPFRYGHGAVDGPGAYAALTGAELPAARLASARGGGRSHG